MMHLLTPLRNMQCLIIYISILTALENVLKVCLRVSMNTVQQLRAQQYGEVSLGAEARAGTRAAEDPDTRGDRHSSRVEAKNPALLSNRDGYLLELTGWTQGSQAS